jgi:hypothetical protein
MPLVLHGKDVSVVHDSEASKFHSAAANKNPVGLDKKGNGALLTHRSIALPKTADIAKLIGRSVACQAAGAELFACCHGAVKFRI